MAASQVYKTLWGAGIVFVILPHLNVGLLSDYKICGDSECESMMSRVQAIRDHHGKDCRFLSFRRGDTIFVYHKLTGKRDDLWAGSIDKQFGYFPKDAVQVEHVHATTEKVVETQESDVFCLDELGSIIDSSHLDSDGADVDDEKIQNQESETTPYTEDTNAESPLPADVSTEPPVSAQEADGTSAEEDESKNASDAAARTNQEVHEAPAAPSQQGGSASSAWLGSSVTGWLGLGQEEEPGNVAEGEKKDEGKETQAEASFTSSVTGWLGLGGGGKPDDALKSEEEERETTDSLTSTMTGWLGFGGEKQTDHSAEKEQDGERENNKEQEPEDTFRSRRMSLDLEGSQLHQEEKEEVGTLDWLGKGLSNSLGFGLTRQEPEHQTTTERDVKGTVQEEEQPASSSWFDVEIRDILGSRKVKSETDDSAGSGFNNDNDISTSDSSKDGVLPEDATSQVDQKDISPQYKLEEKSQAGDEMFQIGSKEEEEDVLDDNNEDTNVSDGERSIEMEGEAHQAPKSIESVGEDINRKPGEEEMKAASDTDQDFLTQSDINAGPDFSSVGLNSNSMEQSAGEVGEDKTEDVVEERAEIPNQIDNTEESTDTSDKIGDGDGGEGNNTEVDVLTQTDEPAEQSQVSGGVQESSRESPPFLSDTAEDRNKPDMNKDDTLTAHSKETNVDHSDSLAMIDNNTEAETHQGELGQEGNRHPVVSRSPEFESSHNTEVMSKNALQEDRRPFSTSEGTTQMEDNAGQDPVSVHTQQSGGDAHMLKETVKETEKDSGTNLQPVQTETEGSEKYILNANGLKSALDSERTEGEELEKSKEEGKQGQIEELKEHDEAKAMEKQQEEEEEKKDVVEESKEEERQQEVEEIKVEGEEVEELKEEEKQGLKGEGETDEMVETKEEKKQEEVEELTEDGEREEMKELKEEEKQQQIEELKQEKQEDVEELKEETEMEDLKEAEEVEEKEKKEDEVKQAQSSHFVAEMENSLHSSSHHQKDIDRPESASNEEETQDENSLESVFSETSTQTEKTESPQTEETREEENKKQEEVEDVKDEMKEEEAIEEKQEMENVEDEKRDQEEEGNLKCSNELCPQASVDELVRDRDGNDFANRSSTINEGEKETGKQNPVADDQILADKAGGIQMVVSESTESNEDRKQEEEKITDDAETDEQDEKENSESNRAGNEDVKSNNTNNISDIGALGVNQRGEIDDSDNDLLYSAENGHLPDHITLGQTAEKKDDFSEAKNLFDDEVLHQGDKTKPEDTDTNGDGISTEKKTEKKTHSDHYTEEDTDREEMKINVKQDEWGVNEDADMQMKKNDGNTVGTEFRAEGGIDVSVSSSDPVESQAVIPEQAVPHVSQHPTGSSLPSDVHSEVIVEPESGGGLGIFKNAFSYFSQTPAPEPTEPALGSDSNMGETSMTPPTPEQELDSTTDPPQVYTRDSHTDSPITPSQQQLQPSPPPFIQTSSPSQTHNPSQPSSLSPGTGNPLLTKTLSKHYKSLLAYMSMDEMNILMELFGRHKLQFLDYILKSSETMTDDPDNDESILLDIERLLHYHMETLVGPNMRLADPPQEDEQKAVTLVALEKLEMLLARVRETFNTAKSDISNTNHQAEASKYKETATKEESSKLRGSSVGMDNNSPRSEWMGTGKEGLKEDEKRGKKEGSSEPGPSQSLEEVMKQILDFAHQFAEDSTTHAHAAMELLTWLTVQSA